METNDGSPQKPNIGNAIKDFKEGYLNKNKGDIDKNILGSAPVVNPITTPNDFNATMNKETDPDLIIGYELIPLPSEGKLYPNGLKEVEVEYMTSQDEDLLTTPSLIESGKVLDVLLKRKIKTKGVVVDDLLPGDRNAILLFLRSSSYGADYSVQVSDPRTGIMFTEVANLNKLKYKGLTKIPNEFGQFSVFIPMRKKTVLFRLLTTGEDQRLFETADEIKKAYNQEFSSYQTMKLKTSIVSIEGNTDPTYISKFVDAMPARDSLTIRKEILDVQPDVDMGYEFTADDGFKFIANLQITIDFFFPSN